MVNNGCPPPPPRSEPQGIIRFSSCFPFLTLLYHSSKFFPQYRLQLFQRTINICTLPKLQILYYLKGILNLFLICHSSLDLGLKFYTSFLVSPIIYICITYPRELMMKGMNVIFSYEFYFQVTRTE